MLPLLLLLLLLFAGVGGPDCSSRDAQPSTNQDTEHPAPLDMLPLLLLLLSLLLFAGVGGPDCSSPDLRPCTNQYRADKSSKQPASHIGPNKRDVNWAASGWTQSRCVGFADVIARHPVCAG
jgi:hypothetical protein